MGTRQQNDESRKAKIAKMDHQLSEWSARLDELVAGYIRAGAQPNDAYHVRITALRTRQEAVQDRLNEFQGPSNPRGPWNAFQETIAEDWKALEAGFKDLTK